MSQKPQKNTAMMYEGGLPGGPQFPTETVFRGEAGPETEQQIRQYLVDGEFFLPQACGIPPAREGLGHVRHRFQGIRTTAAKPTDTRNIREIADAFSRAKEELDLMIRSTGPKVKAWSKRP
jgi:hypothetical protein